jgi:regulator of replication initiation timing
VGSSIKSNDLRGQVSSVREQLDRETETNRQLRAELESSQSRLEQCHFILEEFRETTDRDISTIRDCIEIIEETRYTIGCLSYYIDDSNSSDIYDRIDSWLETEGVYPVK